MRLYLLDDEVESPLAGRVAIDYDYQAEQYVQDLSRDDTRKLIVFVLFDDKGMRCVWRRSVEECTERKLPNIARVAERFTGAWQHTLDPEESLEPSDNYERIALNHYRKRFAP